MAKPSESLRRARRWARLWKSAARKLYRFARTFQAQAAAWQTTAMIQDQFAKRENDWHREELQVQRLIRTPDGECSECDLTVPTYRSATTRKLHAANHFFGSLAVGDEDPCLGRFKPVKDSK